MAHTVTPIHLNEVTYVQKYHGTDNVAIVFDGYSDAPRTNGEEQNQRAMKSAANRDLVHR